MFNSMKKERENILKRIINVVYFMRGGIAYDNMLYGMSLVERQLVEEFLEERLDNESKKAYPNY